MTSDNAVVMRSIRTNEVFGPSCSCDFGTKATGLGFVVDLDFRDTEDSGA